MLFAVVHTKWIVVGVSVGVVRLKITDGATEGVGGEEAAEAGGVVAGKGVVEALVGHVGGFRVAFVAGEFVAGWASCGLEPRGKGDFLSIGCEVGVIAKQAGCLACAVGLFATAGGDGARGAELVGEVVEDADVGICAA